MPNRNTFNGSSVILFSCRSFYRMSHGITKCKLMLIEQASSFYLFVCEYINLWRNDMGIYIHSCSVNQQSSGSFFLEKKEVGMRKSKQSDLVVSKKS